MKKLLAGVGLMALAVGAPVLSAQEVTTAYALATSTGSTGQQIVSFKVNNPSVLTSQIFIQGLGPQETLLGIDVRPIDQRIYAVSTASNIYRINYETGDAEFVAKLRNVVGGGDVEVDGTFFGVDFNPVVDRIRVVSDGQQNLRINPLNGDTNVDGEIRYPSESGVIPSLTAVAYFNNNPNQPNPPGTILYGIDTLRNQLYRSTDANAGTYVLQGSLSGADPTELTGFDIERGTNVAYGAFRPMPGSTTSSLYTINLTTGTASFVDRIGRLEEMFVVQGLTLGPAVAPEPGSLTLLAVGALALGARRRRR